MAQQVFPTKSNLMATKKSLALSKQGYELMDRKRNILVREMMQLIDRAAEIQTKIEVAYSSAYRALQRANVTLGMVGKFANRLFYILTGTLDFSYNSKTRGKDYEESCIGIIRGAGTGGMWSDL